MTGPVIVSLPSGEINLAEITGDNPRYEVFLRGWAVGWESRTPEVRRLTTDLDRLYVTMYNPPKIDPRQPTFAELERRRGNPEGAERYERFLLELGVTL